MKILKPTMGIKYEKGELESYTHKICIRCNKILPVENFRKDFRKEFKWGWTYRSYCRECEREMCRVYGRTHRERRNVYLRRWRREHPKLARKNSRKGQLKSKYGLTIEDYNRMLKQQNNKCVICKQERKLVVDHDHKTGRVRGLLCNSCNRIVGIIETYSEDVEKYLNRNVFK